MNQELLSETGEIRRRQILQLAHGEARRRSRRRIVARALLTSLLFAAASLIFVRSKPVRSISIQPAIVVQSPAPQPAAPPAAPVQAVQYIPTDPTITQRLTLPPEPPRWTNLSDEQLFQELADAHQPAGIVRINGKTLLLPQQKMSDPDSP